MRFLRHVKGNRCICPHLLNPAQYVAHAKKREHLVRQGYDELNWQLKRLRAAAADGKLYFVLGAGIGAAYGLVGWRELLLALMRASGRVRLPDDYRSAL